MNVGNSVPPLRSSIAAVITTRGGVTSYCACSSVASFYSAPLTPGDPGGSGGSGVYIHSSKIHVVRSHKRNIFAVPLSLLGATLFLSSCYLEDSDGAGAGGAATEV